MEVICDKLRHCLLSVIKNKSFVIDTLSHSVESDTYVQDRIFSTLLYAQLSSSLICYCRSLCINNALNSTNTANFVCSLSVHQLI
jgi:hypothetical protein